MSLLTWDESFSVKVAEIDAQHQRLFEMINQLYDAMKAGKGKEVISEVLDGLVEYTQVHFATEEKYFDEFHYEHTLAHKLAHKKFVDKVSLFKAQYEAGNQSLSIEIMKFLKEWLTNHIKGTDQQYAGCFQEHGLK
jgi:hemerythrin